MAVPSFLQSALWSYNLRTLDPKRYKRMIIAQILNHGHWKQLQWLLRTYSAREIKYVVLNPARGVWMNDVFNYWETLLGVKVPPPRRERALFSLTPRTYKYPRLPHAKSTSRTH